MQQQGYDNLFFPLQNDTIGQSDKGCLEQFQLGLKQQRQETRREGKPHPLTFNSSLFIISVDTMKEGTETVKIMQEKSLLLFTVIPAHAHDIA